MRRSLQFLLDISWLTVCFAVFTTFKEGEVGTASFVVGAIVATITGIMLVIWGTYRDTRWTNEDISPLMRIICAVAVGFVISTPVIEQLPAHQKSPTDLAMYLVAAYGSVMSFRILVRHWPWWRPAAHG